MVESLWLTGRCLIQTETKQSEACCSAACLLRLGSHLLGLLQGDGLDWPEELVLRVLSGLLSEHIRSMFKVLWQASQSRLPLHLVQ